MEKFILPKKCNMSMANLTLKFFLEMYARFVILVLKIFFFLYTKGNKPHFLLFKTIFYLVG